MPSSALLGRLLFAMGVASLGACGSSGDGTDVSSTNTSSPGQGGAGQGGSGQGGAGGNAGASGGQQGGSSGQGGQAGASGGQQGGASGQSGQAGQAGQAGGGGYGGYSNVSCGANACSQVCATSASGCGGPDDPEVKAAFASCPLTSVLSPPTATPLPDGSTQCCWQQYCPGGRPLLAGGGARVAGLVRASGWA